MFKFKKKQDAPAEQKTFVLPYEHCLNCGAELKGKYCHVCGQPATAKVPSIPAFIKVYFNHSLVWDPRFFRTLKTLVRRPGQLTNEYIAGKFTSQEHPIKLNMFLLFVFITMFVFFGSDKLSNTLQDYMEDERYTAGIQMGMLTDNEDYMAKMSASPRDTILLHAPLTLATEHPDIITHLETLRTTKGDSLDDWKAAVPHVLIEDKIIVPSESGDAYHFSSETATELEDNQLLIAVWTQMVKFTTKYFPMMVLFTAPFVVFALRLVQRKEKRPTLHHLVFALHYTAIIELLILFIYVLYLTFAPPTEVLQWVLLLGSCVYLTLAFRNVYGVTSWFKSITKAAFTTFYYVIIIIIAFLMVFFAAAVAAIIAMVDKI